MTREYMVVYERCAGNWSAFSPDILGCGSLGDELEDTRRNMREAIELFLEETAKAGEPIPIARAKSVDFEEFDPKHETKEYFVEWMRVSLPRSQTPAEATQAA